MIMRNVYIRNPTPFSPTSSAILMVRCSERRFRAAKKPKILREMIKINRPINCFFKLNHGSHKKLRRTPVKQSSKVKGTSMLNWSFPQKTTVIRSRLIDNSSHGFLLFVEESTKPLPKRRKRAGKPGSI